MPSGRGSCRPSSAGALGRQGSSCCRGCAAQPPPRREAPWRSSLASAHGTCGRGRGCGSAWRAYKRCTGGARAHSGTLKASKAWSRLWWYSAMRSGSRFPSNSARIWVSIFRVLGFSSGGRVLGFFAGVAFEGSSSRFAGRQDSVPDPSSSFTPTRPELAARAETTAVLLLCCDALASPTTRTAAPGTKPSAAAANMVHPCCWRKRCAHAAEAASPAAAAAAASAGPTAAEAAARTTQQGHQ